MLNNIEKKKFFVFVDESGVNEQENFFLLGCLFVPVEKIGEYYDLLQKTKAKIVGKVKRKEKELEETLSIEDFKNFYKGRKRNYEIKFSNINNNVVEEYIWFLLQYFKFPDVRYCCLIIDKKKYHDPQHLSFFDVYINQLEMLLKNNIKDNEEIVLLPDDITISGKDSYEKTITDKLRNSNKKVFGTHRIESHSNIFVQLVDLLTGSVLYDLVEGKKNPAKLNFIKKIKGKIKKKKLGENITVKTPNYFSIWEYKK